MKLCWDDLLDDYEHRIDGIASALANDASMPIRSFIAPEGEVDEPTAEQVERFQKLQARAALAAEGLIEKLESNRNEVEHGRRATVAHKAYMVADRLA